MMAGAANLVLLHVGLTAFMCANARKAEKGRVAGSHDGAHVADVDDGACRRQTRKIGELDREPRPEQRRCRSDLSVTAPFDGDQRGGGKRRLREKVPPV